MGTPCGSLNAGLDLNCNNLITSGTDNNLLLISKENWDDAVAGGTITFDATTNNLITDCVLSSSGKQGYLFETGREQVKPKVAMEIKNGFRLHKQEVEFPIQKLDAASEKVLDDLSNILVVASYKNTFHGTTGDAKYKVLGVESGLILSKREIESDGDFGGWIIGLSSGEKALESVGQYSLYKTDEATTDGIYAALQVATT